MYAIRQAQCHLPAEGEDFAGSLTTDIMTPQKVGGRRRNCSVSLGQRGYHPRVCGLPLPVADVLLGEAPDTSPLSLRSQDKVGKGVTNPAHACYYMISPNQEIIGQPALRTGTAGIRSENLIG